MTATTGRYSDPAYLVSVAPMMACTDRHCRLFLRLIAPGVRLYTEMITAQALVHGDAGRWLRHDPREHPVALQLGGADPDLLAAAARLAEAAGYAEINLNVGCPSDRVRDGAFGACLMKDASRVAACVAAMRGAVSVPVTVKTRIGVDDCDSYEFLRDFVGNVAAAGSDTFIVHARKAWLTGLSPHENRTIPPLRHEVVARLRTDFPRLKLISNGGLNDLGLIRQQLAAGIDGVMIGR
jgi:tRNA-dihydrouridine synthase A